MSKLAWDGTAEPVSRHHFFRRERGQINIQFPCSADHEQDWQPYPVDLSLAICDDHIYIHTYTHNSSTVHKYLAWYVLSGTCTTVLYYSTR